MSKTQISERLKAITELSPSATALYFGSSEYGWDDLRALADRLGETLHEAGLDETCPVGWIARNDPNVVAGALGLLISGNCISPINPHVAAAKLASDIDRFAHAAVIGAAEDWTDANIAAAEKQGILGLSLHLGSDDSIRKVTGSFGGVREHHARTDPDIVLERISSGTTGDPKRFLVRADTFVKALGFAATSEPGGAAGDALALKRSPALVFNTFAHSAGLWGVATALYHARPIVLHDRFTVDGWAQSVRRFRPKMLSLMPAMIAMVMEEDVPVELFAGVIAVRAGSAPLPPATQRAFEEKYGVPVLIDYGASEFMGGIASWSLADRKRFGETKRGSVGRLRPDIEARIVNAETGEAVVAGEQGVLHLKTPRHGPDWVVTTDLASIDEDGFLSLHGRADEAINRGGFKILPEEVADLLRDHPAIREVAVLGVRNERLGQVPVAFVELVDGENPSPDELVEFARDRMPPYFVPVAFEFVREMPRTNSLKISRPALREQFAGKYVF